MPKIGEDFHGLFLSAAQQKRLEIAHQNAEQIIKDLSPVYVHETMELYTAPQGILVPNGQVTIGKALEEIEGMFCTVANQNLVLNHIKNKTVTPLADLEPPSDLIPVKNGAVSISTGELLPYRKGMNFHNQFPIVYDPNARARNFMRFLNNTQRDELRRQHILEAFARCFDRTPMKRQAELFIGEPDTGKTTLLKVLRCMFGQKNVASETLQSLTNGEDRWAIGNLLHKPVNICADLQTIEITELGRFKTLTGGDPVTAEFKGRPKFEFMPYTKFFFACNSTPKIDDDDLEEDIAFFERFRITYFDHQVPAEERDESLVLEDRPEESKLINQQEISGLFNLCLRILQEMRRTSDFRYNFNGYETKAIWFHELSQNKKVDDFVATFTIAKEDGKIPVVEFKERLNVWLLRRQQEMLSANTINVRMQQKYGDQVNIHGKGRCWRRLAWRDESNASLLLPGVTQQNSGFPGTFTGENNVQNIERSVEKSGVPERSSLRRFFTLIEKDSAFVAKNGTADAVIDKKEDS